MCKTHKSFYLHKKHSYPVGGRLGRGALARSWSSGQMLKELPESGRRMSLSGFRTLAPTPRDGCSQLILPSALASGSSVGCLHLVAGVPVCQQLHFHPRSPSAFFNGGSAPSPWTFALQPPPWGWAVSGGGSPSLSCHMSWAVSLFSTSLVIHRKAYQVFFFFFFNSGYFLHETTSCLCTQMSRNPKCAA